MFRSRCTPSLASCKANATQKYIRIIHSTIPASSAPKLLWCTRVMSASPSSALSVTVSAGFFTIESLISISLTPMAAPGGFGQLTVAFGFLLRRKPLRDWRCLHIRDGTDNSAHVQGADRRCARPQIHGGKGLPGGDAVLAGAQTGAASAAASCPQYLGKTGRTRERTAAARVG